MDIRQKELRNRIKAETDLDVTEHNLSDYSYWLERYKSKEINKDLLLENNHLKDLIHKVINILDDGLTKRVREEG